MRSIARHSSVSEKFSFEIDRRNERENGKTSSNDVARSTFSLLRFFSGRPAIFSNGLLRSSSRSAAVSDLRHSADHHRHGHPCSSVSVREQTWLSSTDNVIKTSSSFPSTKRISIRQTNETFFLYSCFTEFKQTNQNEETCSFASASSTLLYFCYSFRLLLLLFLHIVQVEINTNFRSTSFSLSLSYQYLCCFVSDLILFFSVACERSVINPFENKEKSLLQPVSRPFDLLNDWHAWWNVHSHLLSSALSWNGGASRVFTDICVGLARNLISSHTRTTPFCFARARVHIFACQHLRHLSALSVRLRRKLNSLFRSSFFVLRYFTLHSPSVPPIRSSERVSEGERGRERNEYFKVITRSCTFFKSERVYFSFTLQKRTKKKEREEVTLLQSHGWLAQSMLQTRKISLNFQCDYWIIVELFGHRHHHHLMFKRGMCDEEWLSDI